HKHMCIRDSVYEVLDSVSGQMARMRYRSGGRWHSPVTIRSPFGGGVHTPELHACLLYTSPRPRDPLHDLVFRILLEKTGGGGGGGGAGGGGGVGGAGGWGAGGG
ncbi:hypothetical protein ACQ4LK_24830, partial [Bacillus pumilus]